MRVMICDSKERCSRKAAEHGMRLIREAIAARGEASIILSTGTSQFNLLAELVRSPHVDWHRVTGFHLDEYIGITMEHPASFRRYLKERFVSLVPIKAFHYINGEGNLCDEIERQGEAIRRHTIDVAFVGIGENGHLAFNDPPADFDTLEPFLIVDLDENCRKQQVGEGWFRSIDEVPTRAISMSIRQIMKSRAIIATVPDARKAEAVRNCMEGPATPQAPASILREHERATLYLDRDSASLLQETCERF